MMRANDRLDAFTVAGFPGKRQCAGWKLQLLYWYSPQHNQVSFTISRRIYVIDPSSFKTPALGMVHLYKLTLPKNVLTNWVAFHVWTFTCSAVLQITTHAVNVCCRDEIAACIEKAYERIAFGEAARMLFFESEKPMRTYAQEVCSLSQFLTVWPLTEWNHWLRNVWQMARDVWKYFSYSRGL